MIKASEKYESLRDSLKPVFGELNVNSLLKEKKIQVQGKTVNLNIVFGSDLKVHVFLCVHVHYIISHTHSLCCYCWDLMQQTLIMLAFGVKSTLMTDGIHPLMQVSIMERT